MQIFLFFALAIAAVAVLFAVQNNAQTTVSFLFWNFNGSLALILLIALAVGALISFLLSLPSSIRSSLTIRSQKKKISELQANLDNPKPQLSQANKKTDGSIDNQIPGQDEKSASLKD